MNQPLNIPELTPVHRDLLRVLRAAVAGNLPDTPPADWVAVQELARLHQVDHFLYPIVRAWDPAFQPVEELMLKWRNSFLSAVALYTRASIQTAEFLTALHTEQVRVVPLKGVWLAENIYEDGTCRPMCDIDLLVHPEDLDRARSVFEQLGYTTKDYFSSVERDKHIRYNRPDAALPIELHWRLWHPGKKGTLGEPDPSLIWEGVQEEKLHGVQVLVFPPDRQLIYLAKHIQGHNLTVPLRAYLDLILLSRCYQLNLSRLNEEARAWQVPFGAKFILQVAFDILGGAPASLTSFMPDDGTHEEERREAVCAALQLTDESQQLTPAMAACHQASWLHRLELGLSRVFVSPDMIRSNYSQVVHRFGLVGGYISRCADLIRRRSRTWRNVARNDPALHADLANFASRKALSTWIHAQDSKNTSPYLPNSSELKNG